MCDPDHSSAVVASSGLSPRSSHPFPYDLYKMSCLFNLHHSHDDLYLSTMKFIIFAALVAIVVADKLPVHIPIVAETRQEPVDGASASDFESGNGIRFIQKAVAGGAGQSNAEGVFSYPDEHGNVIEVRYVANEFGFQPQGAHLPVAPPAPAHVADLLRIAAEQRAAGITFE
ncbi:cuticle protein AMP1B-like [Oratosquilla oratoria]|uniref:cuticle protein AMP1B-like n=2 Tax=Oratosquilla oratoria TaxID=337810 RepID=UPI003F765135